MGDLKWITRKEFEAYLRVKEFMEKNNYDEADLRKKIRDRRPAPIPLIIRSNNMEPRKYESLTWTWTWTWLTTSTFQGKLSYMHIRLEGLWL